MLIDISPRSNCKGRLDFVKAWPIRHGADVAILNRAFAAAPISIEKVSVIASFRDDDSIATEVLALKFLICKQAWVHLCACQAIIARLDNLSRKALGAVVVKGADAGSACRMAVYTLSQSVTVAIHKVVPLEVLPGTTLRYLAVCSNQKVP